MYTSENLDSAVYTLARSLPDTNPYLSTYEVLSFLSCKMWEMKVENSFSHEVIGSIQWAEACKMNSISLVAKMFKSLDFTTNLAPIKVKVNCPKSRNYLVSISLGSRLVTLLTIVCNRGLALWNWPKTFILDFQVLTINEVKIQKRVTRCWLVRAIRGQVETLAGRDLSRRVCCYWPTGKLSLAPTAGLEASRQCILILIITLSWSLRKSRTTSWAGRMWQWRNWWPLLVLH